jgi:hypothetical protein
MDEPNQPDQEDPAFESLSQGDDQASSQSQEADAPASAVEPANVEVEAERIDLDGFQASRTQSLNVVDFQTVEDDDEGHLAAEYAEGAPVPDSPPGRAHDSLEIRTPVEEFETYVRARIDTLTRLGETKRVDLTLEALELGKRRLAQITGISLP